jgi:hypothetical protein
MRKEIADLWCDALESGEYTQGGGGLCKDGKHCCLGVLTDLCMKQGGDIRFENIKGLCFYNGYCNTLPSEVCEWAGIKTSIGIIETPIPSIVEDYKDYKIDLIYLNDGCGWDFKQISGFIKEHWEKL